MKKMNYIYGCLAAVCLMASCSGHTNEPAVVASPAINLKTAVAPLTRVPQLNDDGSGNFNTGDVISVFVDANNQKTIKADYAQGSSFITWDDLNLPAGTHEVTFASCYPKQEISSDGTFEFNTHTAEYKDLLLSKAQKVTVGTTSPIVLTFNHALHMLNLTFATDGSYTTEELEKLTVTCRAKTTCVVNAVTGAVGEIKTSTADYVSEGPQTTFYLVPQPTQDIMLTVRINQLDKVFKLSELLDTLGNSQTNLQGSKRCNIALTVGKDGISLQGGSIGAWEDQVTAEGDITIG